MQQPRINFPKLRAHSWNLEKFEPKESNPLYGKQYNLYTTCSFIDVYYCISILYADNTKGTLVSSTIDQSYLQEDINAIVNLVKIITNI